MNNLTFSTASALETRREEFAASLNKSLGGLPLQEDFAIVKMAVNQQGETYGFITNNNVAWPFSKFMNASNSNARKVWSDFVDENAAFDSVIDDNDTIDFNNVSFRITDRKEQVNTADGLTSRVASAYNGAQSSLDAKTGRYDFTNAIKAVVGSKKGANKEIATKKFWNDLYASGLTVPAIQDVSATIFPNLYNLTLEVKYTK